MNELRKGTVDVARITRGLLLATSTSAPDSSLARISAAFVVVVSVVVSFLQQILVEFPEEEEAQGSGCLPGAESPQAARAPLPPLAAAEAVSPREELRGA